MSDAERPAQVEMDQAKLAEEIKEYAARTAAYQEGREMFRVCRHLSETRFGLAYPEVAGWLDELAEQLWEDRR